jgi:hypothetical protein
VWHGAAGQGSAWQGKAWNVARRGSAWRGGAGHGKEHGRAFPQEQQTNNNPMETTHSKALMAYAGQLYDAYMTGCGGIDWLDKPLPSWSDYVCNPNNKRRVEAWVDVARVAIRIETEVRDNAL